MPRLPVALLALLLGCAVESAPRDGFVVTSHAASAEYGIRAGDTLREVAIDTLPRPLRVALRAADPGAREAAGCARAFVGDTIVWLYHPTFCGREWRTGDGLDLPVQRLFHRDGRPIPSDRPWRFAATICPMDRAPDGRPAFGAYWRVDGCYHDPDDAPDSLLTEGTIIGNGVILPDAVQRGLLDQCSREVPRRAEFEWTPSVAMIADLERRLPAWLEEQNANLPVPLDRYWRQYGGYGVGRDSLIYINLGTPWDDERPPTPNPRRAQLVCDGGKGYFGLVYDPRTRRFSQLAFNGTG